MSNDKQKTFLVARASLQEVSASEATEISIPNKVVANEGMTLEDQRDLLKMSSVLVSTGMNLNDDVFLPEEILPARDTGAHKPVNIEHDETRIIGHMLRTFVTAKDGTRVDEEELQGSDSVPSEFDITNEAVIYAFVLPEIARDIKQKAVAGELFVSVEAWFTDFDYLVGNKVVARNKDTAPILDGVLRVNGGAGRFEGQKVGRVLRNILFGGIGVVAVPANPESVIRSVGSGGSVELSECDVESIDEVLAQHVVGSLNCSTSTQEEEKDMSGTSGEKLTRDDVLEEVAAIMEAKEANKAQAAADETPETQTEEGDSRIDNLQEENRSLSERIAKFEVAELKQVRSAALVEAGLSEDQAKARITKVVAMNDEEFTAYLEDVRELVSASGKSTDEGGSETDETAEAGRRARAEDKEEDSDEEMDDEDKAEEKAKSSVEEDEDISLDLGDINQVDPEVPVRSNSSAKLGEGDLVSRFEKALQPALEKRNPKLWGNKS